ncbi:MAG: ABC transporter ATP-binding protein [Candidatus Melainabacteria bacterium]
MTPLLQTEQLTKVYEGIQPVYAIRDITLTIEHGEFLSVIGPSGSGKSTLMHILGLLDTPTSGRLVYKGQDAARWDARQKALFRNQSIGFIFQAHMLMPEFTALENVLMPTRIAQTYSPQMVDKAKSLLEQIGLADRIDFRPTELSGGQNQRVAIARALMNTPAVVFADEPTGALDSKTSVAVYELLRKMNRTEDVAFVIVTHEQALADKTDRKITLLDGHIQSDERLVPHVA